MSEVITTNESRSEEVIARIVGNLLEKAQNTSWEELWQLETFDIPDALKAQGEEMPSQKLVQKTYMALCREAIPHEIVIERVVNNLRNFAGQRTGGGNSWLMEGKHVQDEVLRVAPWLTYDEQIEVYMNAYAILRQEVRQEDTGISTKKPFKKVDYSKSLSYS